MTTRTRRLFRRRTWLILLLAAITAAMTAVVNRAVAAPAPHAPFGQFDTATQSGTGLLVRGWAIDPDTTGAINVDVYLDGRGLKRLTAETSRPDVGRTYARYGDRHGFSAVLPVPDGRHTVCAYGINVGPGGHTLLGCRNVTISFSPFGSLDVVKQSGDGFLVSGWAIDPDSNDPINVDVYADNTGLKRLVANGSRPDVARAYPGHGLTHGFAAQFAIPEGTHSVCVFAINVGPGSHTLLGCSDVSIDFRPFGSFDSARQAGNALRVSGWAIDPDTNDPINVDVYATNATTTKGVRFLADGVRSDVAQAFPGRGDKHGFVGLIPLDQGTYNVCAYAINTGNGNGNPSLGCTQVTIDHSPYGNFDGISRTGTTSNITVRGWAIDPDSTGPVQISVTIDGKAAGTLNANQSRPDVGAANPGMGNMHGFSGSFTADEGEHTACLTAKNLGAGADTSLGCKLIIAVHPKITSVPQAVAAEGGFGGATVAWTAPADDGGAPPTSYTVRSNPDGITVTVPGNTTSATVMGLRASTSYSFAVTATNAAGTSAAGGSPTVKTEAVPPPQTTPAPISTSRYIRNIRGASSTDLNTLRAFGAADARANPSGHGYLILLQIGGQFGDRDAVMLSATTRVISYSDIVANMKAYVDGYASQQKPSAPVIIAIGTNNDMAVSGTTGRAWAQKVVNPVVSYAGRYMGIAIAGANDIEPGFRGTYAQTKAWLDGYLATTSAPFVNNGSADGCSWTQTNKACNNGWTMAGLYTLSGGAAPTRIIHLPQIYNDTMAQQWKYISLTGVGSGKPRINFGGALTEWTACSQAGTCGSLTGNQAWSQMWKQLQSAPQLRVPSLPYSTDLRIDK